MRACSIYARNNNAAVPAVPRIFCVNEFESVFGDDPFLGGHYSVQRRVFEFDTDKNWGMCYYRGEVVEGETVPIVPSNTPEDMRVKALDLRVKALGLGIHATAVVGTQSIANLSCEYCLYFKEV